MIKKIYDIKGFEVDLAAQHLLSFINKNFGYREDCFCYYKNPIYYTHSGIKPTLVIVDREYGVITFKSYNYNNEQIRFIGEDYWELNGEKVENEIEYFNDYCYELSTDIYRPSNKLMKKVNFNQYVVFPFLDYSKLEKKDYYIEDLYNSNSVLFDDYLNINLLDNLEIKRINDADWKLLQSIIQKANALSKNNGIRLREPLKNLGEAIIFNENKICVLDEQQLDASMQLTEEAERIRGLAGTGKTIVLAMKAARLHYEYPEAQILYTFYTQSLYTQITNLVSLFYRKLKGDEPNFDNLKIMHSWGGKVKKGVYSHTCSVNGIRPKTYRDVRYSSDPFGSICEELINNKLLEEYDYVLIDEAQDLPISFFRLIEKITKSPKRIVWAYDELQSTGDITIPDADELFGFGSDGQPRVVLNPKNDFILKKSYRNNINVLFLAIGLGFGMYSKRGIVQMINREETWRALGFKLERNSLGYDKIVEIERPIENSPNNIQNYFDKYPILGITESDNKINEYEKIAIKIKELIKDENVKPHNIIVIDLNTQNAKNSLPHIQRLLFNEEINSTIPGFVDGADDFLVEENVTLTTPRRAKGNEAAIIFVLSMEYLYECDSDIQDRLRRNLAFISITRSKGWCFLSGSGEKMKIFLKEYEDIFKDFPVFKFKYPSKEKLERIQKINYITKDNDILNEYKEQLEVVNKLLEKDPEILNILIDSEQKNKLLNYFEKLQK